MAKFIRSLVKASSFSLAGSIFEKIGTPFRSSTSSLRFIASSCSQSYADDMSSAYTLPLAASSSGAPCSTTLPDCITTIRLNGSA